MTDSSTDEAAESDAPDEPPESGELQEEQEQKGYGADEGERERSLGE